ncbi:hypothetical protein X975_13228, partial [Stegodyphus mimosarum]
MIALLLPDQPSPEALRVCPLYIPRHVQYRRAQVILEQAPGQ